jgi:hypothetical protein
MRDRHKLTHEENKRYRALVTVGKLVSGAATVGITYLVAREAIHEVITPIHNLFNSFSGIVDNMTNELDKGHIIDNIDKIGVIGSIFIYDFNDDVERLR